MPNFNPLIFNNYSPLLNLNGAKITIPRQLILHLVAQIASPLRFGDWAEFSSDYYDEARVAATQKNAVPSCDVGIGRTSHMADAEEARPI